MSDPIKRRYGPSVPYRQVQVLLNDGCNINVHVLREATSESFAPVAFIHALAMDGRMWQGVVDALNHTDGALHGAMYALDCRGHGASGTSAGAFTTEQFAQDIAAVLDALDAARAHIVGCSMGGTVALEFAGRFPQRVVSLTVIDSTAWYGLVGPENWEKRAQTALADGMGSLVDFQLARWFSPPFLEENAELVRESIAVFTANRVSDYVNSCRMLGNADERSVITAYTGPAAVVVGEEDYATPIDMAKDIAARLPGATLSVIPGTRHYTPLEAPKLVAACIAEVTIRA